MPLSDHAFWKNYPPVMKRPCRTGTLLTVLATVLVIGGILFFRDVLLAGHLRTTALIFFVSFLPHFIGRPICGWRLRGIRRDWHASLGRLCTHCGYDVSKLAPVGACPECGNHYDIDVDAKTWKLAGLSLKSNTDPRSK